MADKIRVKPAKGLTVIHPEAGTKMRECEIERSPAIIRLIKDGDLVIVKKKKAPKKTGENK